MKCGNIVTHHFKCSSAEKPDHGHRLLPLRARCERARSRRRHTADKGDELAPLHFSPRKKGHAYATFKG